MPLSKLALRPVPDFITSVMTSVIIRDAVSVYMTVSFCDDVYMILLSESTIDLIHVGFLYIPSFSSVEYADAISSVDTPVVKPPSAVAVT